MFHTPAHKNLAHPAAQVSCDCGHPVPGRECNPACRHPEPLSCTCGPVKHWTCNAGCRALSINNAVAAARLDREATLAEFIGLKQYPAR